MSVWPAWKVRDGDGVTAWFQARLAFADGATVDALAVVAAGCVRIEDVQARPALSLADLTVLAEWLQGPLFEACGVVGESCGEKEPDGTCEPYVWSCEPSDEPADGPRRARPAWPRGIEGRRLIAQAYRAAQAEGADPVLAVMCATGHSRRRSLRLIAQARDAGFLTPRHARRS
ncbi:hypothetical protein SSP24_27440 [Streptomyces spinoverrucosus]|uniref:Uncharacterized protein n=1 Tax=Streptomyces spinoverrucosus TaxID=284043 RepID=A0A4Y3VHE8_9ACTN|nr:DUF6214 family protein [Streptomyces spinoverrucosus]GEC05089.1 hypothetical protein SSP24_27440 [Streptomyces spinoverrucosus]GHB71821.1 hypothetical protein GCM10010397_47600 [Streptomyces spinoverrucosus]